MLLNLLVTAYLLATCNATFWRYLQRALPEHPIAMVALGVAFSVWAFFIVSLLSPRRLQKPVLAFLVVVGAVSSYYQDTFGTVIDQAMMQSVLTTTVNEGKHLFTLGMVGYVAIRVIPGLALVFWPRVRRGPIIKSALKWVGINATALAVIVAILLPGLSYFAGTLRGHKELVHTLQPLATLNSTLGYVRQAAGTQHIVLKPYGRDAKKGPLLAAAKKPVLLVIVAGEASRAQNWSLGGYERDTNPELDKLDIVYYPHTTSCGTETAVSLPCMFSHLHRKEFSYDAALGSENLLDILGRTGFQVHWWDNNTGDKDIAARFHVRFMNKADDPAACARGECTDAVFLPPLKRLLGSITQDTVLVLHQIGSHGPSYWLRYPPEDEVFKPACHTAQLSDCSHEQLVNAYDNTIHFTDWFLAQVITTLKDNPHVDSALFYVADHGESLGENGLYLHGAPYWMAPDYQTHVPMILWAAPDYLQAMNLDVACLKQRASQPASQDNMFSTILGLLDVQTQVRDNALDLTAGCKKGAG
jgi:lipid A ethanolaminephosphotransferase